MEQAEQGSGSRVKRVGVIGSRGYSDYGRLAADLGRARGVWGDFEVISGGASGADTLAERWAAEEGLPVTVIPADWEQFGKSAGPRRNAALVAACDVVIAFWDGESRGTADAIRQARRAGKKVYVRIGSYAYKLTDQAP